MIDYFQIEEVEPEIFYDKPSEAGKISDIAPPARHRHFPPSERGEIRETEEEKLKILEKLASKKEKPSLEESAKGDEEKEVPEGELAEERPPRKKIQLIKTKIFIPLFILVGIGVIGFAFLSLPKAKVEITPKREIISFDMAISADKGISEINFAEKKIPAQLIRMEREASASFLSSGKKLKESKARGTITVYNNYSSSSQALVATTRFISENGKLFRTTSTANIPGATVAGGKITSSTYDVEVVAAEPGEDYNIGPSTFSIPGFAGTPKYTGFYGKSAQPMTGGFKGEIKFITKDDVSGARKNLEGQLSNLEGEVSSKIPQNLKLIERALGVAFEEASLPKAGEETEKFDMALKGVVSALVFSEDDVKKLIEENIAAKIINDKKSLPKTQKIVYSIKSINLNDGKMDLSVKAEESVTWRIETESLRESLASKTIPEVKEYLSSSVSIENAKVTLWPFWVKRFPSKPEKIKIEEIVL